MLGDVEDRRGRGNCGGGGILEICGTRTEGEVEVGVGSLGGESGRGGIAGNRGGGALPVEGRVGGDNMHL